MLVNLKGSNVITNTAYGKQNSSYAASLGTVLICFRLEKMPSDCEPRFSNYRPKL